MPVGNCLPPVSEPRTQVMTDSERKLVLVVDDTPTGGPTSMS
jgi:hypothetical protein